jgi:hypothetical protein
MQQFFPDNSPSLPIVNVLKLDTTTASLIESHFLSTASERNNFFSIRAGSRL